MFPSLTSTSFTECLASRLTCLVVFLPSEVRPGTSQGAEVVALLCSCCFAASLSVSRTSWWRQRFWVLLSRRTQLATRYSSANEAENVPLTAGLVDLVGSEGRLRLLFLRTTTWQWAASRLKAMTRMF